MGTVLRLMDAKRTLGFKLETTAYTAETLAVTDYDVSAYDIQFSPEIAMYTRALARGDYSKDLSIAGGRKCGVTFSVDLHSGSAAATAPADWKCLRACGLKQTTHGSTGVSLLTDASYNRVPATIEVPILQEGASPKQLVVKIHGAMGNAKLVLNQSGQPVAVQYDFQGVLNGITTRAYASLLTPTNFDSALPQAVLSATIYLFATDMFLNQFTIDLGNEVEVFTDPSKAQGYEGARIVNRNPTIELDPDMVVTDDLNLYSNHINNTTGALSITIGTNTTISAPKAQIIDSYKPGAREGHLTNQLKCELKRNLGNDELEILQGSKT